MGKDKEKVELEDCKVGSKKLSEDMVWDYEDFPEVYASYLKSKETGVSGGFESGGEAEEEAGGEAEEEAGGEDEEEDKSQAKSSKRGKSVWSIIRGIGGMLLLGVVVGVLIVYGISLAGAKNTKLDKGDIKAQKIEYEKTAERIQEISDSKDLDKCDKVFDSVPGEPKGKWCKLGEFQILILDEE